MKMFNIILLVSLTWAGCKEIKNDSTRERNNVVEVEEVTSNDEVSPERSQINGCERCKVEYIIDVKNNIDDLSYEQIDRFLCTLDQTCSSNAELSQVSNELLFSVLSKYPGEVLRSIKENEDIQRAYLLKEFNSPIHDGIDLKKAYDAIAGVEGNDQIKSQVSNSLKGAMDKY